MARTDTLPHFLTDVADAIREKKGTQETIQASDFDTEIENLPSGGDISEYFNITISNNTTQSSPFTLLKKAPDVTVADNVESLSFAFYNAPFAPKIINNNNVTSFSHTYHGCRNTQIDLSNINTSSATSLTGMFENCENLTTIDLSNFVTSNVGDFSEMFFGCLSLTEIDLSNFYVGANKLLGQMFYYCLNLRKIDIRNFDLANATGTFLMFGSSSSDGVPDNCEIIVADNTQKDWMNNNFSRLTNVKTVAEYEAE